MQFYSHLRRAASAVLASTLFAAPAFAAAPRISGPHVHENLAVYLVHGPSAAGAVPLTLQEAIAKGSVRVIETGNVNQLEVENTGTEEVFVQAGDIVKGGKQDRVLTISLLLSANSGKIPIGAFCVEQGRWAARGVESVQRFASSDTAMPSREAKLAMAMPAKPTGSAGGHVSGEPPVQQAGTAAADRDQRRQAVLPSEMSDTSRRQGEVWDKVKKTQEKLSGSLGVGVASVQSQSSLQLSLENERLRQAQTAYVAALQAVGEKERDVVGLVVAINGKLSSADVYPSNGLFKKMWSKQLNASATEAIGEKSADRSRPTPAITANVPANAAAATHTPPSVEAVQAFLAAAEKGQSSERVIGGRMKLETREADKALLVEAARREGGFVHRNYLAKH